MGSRRRPVGGGLQPSFCEYVETHGDARVPQPYKVDDYRLGKWVTGQRGNNAEGILEAERQRRLQTCPAGHGTPTSISGSRGSAELLKYVEIHGDARVLQSYRSDDYPLGAWVESATHHLRETDPRGGAPTPTAGATRLDMGVRHGPMGGRFQTTPGLRRMHGHARVPRSYKVDGHTLGQWVVTQRQKHAKGTLDADCEHRLEDVPGWTWDALMRQMGAGV